MNTVPSTQIKIYTLTPEEQSALENALVAFVYDDRRDYGAQIHEAVVATMTACPKLSATLSRWKNSANPTGPLAVRNLPVDANVSHGPKSPEAASRHKLTSISEGILLGLTGQLGEPYGVRQEGQGLVSNLSPILKARNTLTGLGSRRSLNAHIENAAARRLPGDRAPDGLALIGLSADPARPATWVADGRAALAQLDETLVKILRDPNRFSMAFPQRWVTHGSPVTVETAIVYGPRECPSFVAAFYGDLVVAKDSDARTALEAFEQALERVSVPLVIEPGVAVLLDNHYCFHGRAAFEPSFTTAGDPYRWLQRVFWTSTLRRFHGWTVQRGRLIEAAAERR